MRVRFLSVDYDSLHFNKIEDLPIRFAEVERSEFSGLWNSYASRHPKKGS